MKNYLCAICSEEVLAEDPITYAFLGPGEPGRLSHKRCAMHNHHPQCNCGLTDQQAEDLGCDRMKLPDGVIRLNSGELARVDGTPI